MLKQRIQSDMKAALKEGDKRRLAVVRLILAAVQQKEIDERAALDDAGVLAVLDRMVKQRRDSIAQYEQAGREDLAAQERYEMEVCRSYMPEPLTEAAIDALIDSAIAETGAASMRDMGRLMGWLKPRLQGRADMGAVGARVRGRLGGGN